MVRMLSRLLVPAAAGCAVAAMPAAAAPVIVDFGLTGTFAPGAPINPLTGHFTVSFDNAGDVTATSSGLTITGLNFAPTSPIVYSYYAADDLLTFGDNHVVIGGFTIAAARNDLGFFYHPGMNDVSALEYSANGGIYAALSATATPGVPEPASWAMMTAGFGLIGYGLRRRRKTTAVRALPAA